MASNDAGQYAVDVKNNIGTVTSSNATLTVTAPVGQDVPKAIKNKSER